MAFRSPNAAVHNPLRASPSALALLGWHADRTSAATPDSIAALLRLDPLAVLRGLRFANAPLVRRDHPIATVPDLVAHLGTGNAERLLLVRPSPVAALSPLRTQWRHSVATALAAERIARTTGLADPEAAWLLGLLCDTPRWLALLQAVHGSRHAPSTADCASQWQLPAPVVAQFQPKHHVPTSADDVMPNDTAALVRLARQQAVAAGFAPGQLPGTVGAAAGLPPGDATTSAALRARFDAVVAPVERCLATPSAADGLAAEAPAENVRLEPMVLGLLDSVHAASARTIAAALTAAAVRGGAWDRACFAKWNPQIGAITWRDRADGGHLPATLHQVQVSVSEAHALQGAVSAGAPTLLQAALRDTAGLLAALSTDELLAVPLNGSLGVPSFLLLDRALTLTPIDAGRERTFTRLLGDTGSLLLENLLLRRRELRARKYALTDPLTRLFNRRMGLLALEREVAGCDRSGRPLTVLMADLDHFKQLNDTHGHLRGDQALRAAADVMRAAMRRGDTLCRYGGEEFVLVLPDTTADEAAVVAARLFTAVQRRGEELGLPLTISLGLTAYRPGDGVEAILQRADYALYASKGHGRNRFSADVEPDDDGALAPSHGTGASAAPRE